MNNATYFDGRNGRMGLYDAFGKYCKYNGGTVNGWTTEYVLKFAQSPAMKCLEHDIGEVVQVKTGNGLLYGTVYRYNDKAFSLDNREGSNEPHYLYVMTKCGSVGTFTEDLVMPEFPQGLVDLVRSQLQSNCPLKEATCHE